MPKSSQRWTLNLSSSTKLPGSSRSSMRSRAVSLPSACCLSMRSWPPPSSACALSAASFSRGSIVLFWLMARAPYCGPCAGERGGSEGSCTVAGMLALAPEDAELVGRDAGQLKDVAEFFADALEKLSKHGAVEALANAAPWAKVVAESAAEAFPAVKF